MEKELTSGKRLINLKEFGKCDVLSQVYIPLLAVYTSTEKGTEKRITFLYIESKGNILLYEINILITVLLLSHVLGFYVDLISLLNRDFGGVERIIGNDIYMES